MPPKKEKDDFEDVKVYLTNLRAKLVEKKLQWFWVLADNKVFKPIKEKTKDDFRKVFKEKVNKYKNKHLAEIRVYVNPANVGSKKKVVGIKVVIMKINEDGVFEDGLLTETWGSTVNWYSADIRKMKITLKLIETMMKLTKARTLWTDTLSGITFDYFIEHYYKKKPKHLLEVV
jgi:hypothetical protein